MSETSLIQADDLYDLVLVEDPQISPDGTWVACVRVAIDRVQNEYRRTIWLAASSGDALKPFTSGDKDYAPRWSPDGRYLAFVSNRDDDKGQIYLIPTDGGEARPLTEMPQGADNPAWSPDGRWIAFTSRANAQEREQQDAGQYTEEDQEPAQDAFELEQRREARAHREQQRFDPRVIDRQPYREGTDYLDDRYTHLYVVSTAAADPDATEADKKPRRLTDGDLDYATPIWTSDGKAVLTAATRDPDSLTGWMYQDVFRVPVPEAGAALEVPLALTEPGFNNFDPRPAPDGRFVAYLRQPEERIFAQAPRLAIIPSGGGQPREVAPDFDRGVETFRWSPDGNRLLFTAGDEGDTNVYTVPLEGGIPQITVPGRREVLAFDVARDGQQLAFVASTPQRPPDLYVARLDGEDERRLTDFNAQFLSAKQVRPVEEMWYVAPDGVEIQGWVIKPPGFDPAGSYPLVVEIHGGPHSMWGPSTRSMWHEWQCLAAQGYVVFWCNPRGSDGYGYAFRDAIHSRWGEMDMPDILAGVDHLVAQGYIDTDRMAVTGGSYGGFMTTWIVGHDQRFAAAATQRGVYHLTSFFGTTDIPELIEGEFDAQPWEAYERLWQHSPLAAVKEIQTPLLILHSEWDYRVPIPDAEQLYLMLRWLGREVAFVRYPREGHELSRSGEPRHRVDRLTRIVEWFNRYCKGGESGGS